MLIRRKKGWEIAERDVTPESVYKNRRQFLKGIAAGSIGAAATSLPIGRALAQGSDPTADLYPAMRNPAYVVDRAITDKSKALTYNNFYEFGSHKFISDAAQAMKIRPWTVKIDGMVENRLKSILRIWCAKCRWKNAFIASAA